MKPMNTLWPMVAFSLAKYYNVDAFSPRQTLTLSSRSFCLGPPLEAKTDPTSNGSSSSSSPDNNNQQQFREGSLLAATLKQGKVPYGESSRKYRRTVFGHEDWVQHRSEDRFTENLRLIFFSGIVRQLRKQVALVTFVATLVVLWNSVVVGLLLMDVPQLSLPTLPFTVSSPALGLLLVFRTNSSYQRWLEARVTWGKVISQSRNVVRMAGTFVVEQPDDRNEEVLDDLIRSIWAFSRSLMNQLSGPEDSEGYREELLKAFPPERDQHNFVSYMSSTPQQERAGAALMEVTLVLNNMPIDEKRRVEIDKSLVLLSDCLATCDRIYTAPVPLVYSRHTARFLSLFLLLLPLALYDTFDPVAAAASSSVSWWERFQGIELIPAAAILSLFLFGIEELAVQLEEPFSIFPMQKFCNDIRESASAMKERALARTTR